MRVLQINSVCGVGSTGRIAVALDKALKKMGHQSVIAYGRGEAKDCEGAIRIGNPLYNYMHVARTRILDDHCFGSRSATHVLVDEIRRLDPDLIHLHNVHGYFVNIDVLFDYLCEAGKPVVWTLHDCWPFTGHCAYFDLVGCDRWKEECHHCPQKHEYPSSILLDQSRRNFQRKKRLFTQVSDMTLVTPSMWLASLVSDSFLRQYPVKVLNNGVNLSVFRPRDSLFRERYGLYDQFVILGVASTWGKRKGFHHFMELSQHLGEDERLVMVGVTDSEARSLPDGVIGIRKTNSPEELAEAYSAADVFLNLTLEDNFPTTNLEALGCGTPVITFNTGGSVESVDCDCGFVVETGDLSGLLTSIRTVKARTKRSYSEAAIQRARLLYDDQARYLEYVRLYEELVTH